MTMKVYISGPISGMPDGNRAAFREAERVLREAGYEVFNPHALRLPIDVDWHEAMRQCVGELVQCKGVALLADWDSSEGAMLEQWIANALMIPCRGVGEWVGSS
jgi:nucleoside 2-deoxyribosyltransferase